jgi:hypothetical protein
MFKTIRDMLIGALVAAAVGSAFAVVGTPPLPGSNFAIPDSIWLNGLAGGQNSTYQYAITATGTTQATASQLPSGFKLMQVDTVPSSSGVQLPPCFQGTEFGLYNNGANTLTVYPDLTNNPITSAQDTIDNTTSASVSSHTAELFFCAKNGVWAAK